MLLSNRQYFLGDESMFWKKEMGRKGCVCVTKKEAAHDEKMERLSDVAGPGIPL